MISLKSLQHSPIKRPQYSPFTEEKRNYGATIQYKEGQDLSGSITAQEVTKIKQIMVNFTIM